ncbi:MAG: DUF4149 domain-containing protein [Polyangiaceae bacterium]
MRVLRLLLTVEAVAVAIWLGGVVVVSAVVAPAVFGMVPAPASADAMVVVFERTSRIAMTASVLALLCEVAASRLRPQVGLHDLARASVLALMAAFAIAEGAIFTPRIADLHRQGAIRGDGPLGERMESAHTGAEIAEKAQFALGIAFFGLLVAPPPPAAKPSTPPEGAPAPEGAPPDEDPPAEPSKGEPPSTGT